MNVHTIGLDISKNVMQAHGNLAGATMLSRRLKRNQVIEFFVRLPPCLVKQKCQLSL